MPNTATIKESLFDKNQKKSSATLQPTNRNVSLGPSNYHSALLLLFGTHGQLDTIEPQVYMKASGECVALMLLAGWLLIIIFRADMIKSNPTFPPLGYLSLCVGLDVSPSREIALVLWQMASYFGLRFAVTDGQRLDLMLKQTNEITEKIHRRCIVCNSCYAGSLLLFPLIFVWNPFEKGVYLHTLPFCLLIVGRFICVASNFFHGQSPSILEFKQKMFITIYGIISFLLPVFYMTAYAYYDKFGTRLYSPWLVGFVDYGFFLCLALTTKMFPPSPPLHLVWSLGTGIH